MRMLVAVGVVLAGSPAMAGPQHCEMSREALADALLADCGTPTTGQTASQEKRQHKWWRGEENRTDFGITEPQSRELEAVFQATLPTLKAYKADLDREEKILAQLLSVASSSNEGSVMQAIERVESARSALGRTYTMMQYRMYRLLSADQRAKVQAYHDRKSQSQDNLSTRR